jgi:hypothetical protein
VLCPVHCVARINSFAAAAVAPKIKIDGVLQDPCASTLFAKTFTGGLELQVY